MVPAGDTATEPCGNQCPTSRAAFWGWNVNTPAKMIKAQILMGEENTQVGLSHDCQNQEGTLERSVIYKSI